MILRRLESLRNQAERRLAELGSRLRLIESRIDRSRIGAARPASSSDGLLGSQAPDVGTDRRRRVDWQSQSETERDTWSPDPDRDP